LAKEALRLLEEMPLPNLKQEEWKYTPVARFLDRNYLLGKKAQIGNLSLPQLPLEANLITFINGFFAPELSDFQEIDFTFQNEPAEASKLELEGNFFTCLNVLFAEDGARIYVPKNRKVAKPLWLRSISQTDENAVFSQIRHQITLEKGSELVLIEENLTFGKFDAFQNIVLSADIAENAKLTHYKLQRDNEKGHQVNRSNFTLEDNAQLHDYVFSYGKGFVRNNLDIKLSVNNEVFMNGLTVLTDSAFTDHHTVADHRKPHSYSNQFYKGIYTGNSHCVFNGKIFVRPDAQKTNAFQSNRNILLSDTARIDTKPQLEIFADDVKCSHGATTGRLDDEAMFYLRARGIPFSEARKLLLHAFAGEVMEKIHDENLRDYIEKEIDGLI
jgi:Fe-S cluster assembly protein SufD